MYKNILLSVVFLSVLQSQASQAFGKTQHHVASISDKVDGDDSRGDENAPATTSKKKRNYAAYIATAGFSLLVFFYIRIKWRRLIVLGRKIAVGSNGQFNVLKKQMN